MNRTQLAFSILALFVVFSLVIGAIGTAIVDALTSPDSSDDPITLDESSEDEYEQYVRDQAEQHPDDAASLAALANYLAQTGQLAEAITWYEKSLAIEDQSDVRLDFARSLSDGGKRTDAEFQFKKVIESQPDEVEQAHYYLAELYRNWVPERIPEAVDQYRLTIETGAGTYVAELATQALAELGYATPHPAASPAAATAEVTP